MKRFAYLLPLFLLCAAAPAYAAGISLSPTHISVAAGQSFTINIIVDAGNDRAISGQTELSYPQSLLQPVSFTFAPGWQQTFDDGTDVMAGGLVAKAGGYPTGFSGSKIMGTLTFTALRSGEAYLAVVPGQSYVFETDGGNLFNGGLASAQVDIAPGNGAVSAQAVASAPNAAPSIATTLTPLPGALATTSATAAANALGFSLWVWILLVLLVIAGIVWIRRVSKNKKKRHNR